MLLLSLVVTCVLSVSADDATVFSESDSNLPSLVPDNDIYGGSPAIVAQLAFTNPPYGLYSHRREIDLPVGKLATIVASLSHFNDNPEQIDQRFILDYIEAALHYPMYYEYYIQNFTTTRLQNTLETGQEASILYKFRPAAELAGRSFDLSIVVHYHDNNGIKFAHGLLNQTISLHEVEEGVDTEMIFLVVLVVAVVIAAWIGIWHWFSSKSQHRKAKQAPKTTEPESDTVVENEYITLLNSDGVSKKGRPVREVTRRHGKR